MARSSLAKIVAVNDPDDKGEVRISLGAFIATGSEELGSLQSTDPDRPRVRIDVETNSYQCQKSWKNSPNHTNICKVVDFQKRFLSRYNTFHNESS